ncbi:NOP2/Sun RNA methyltransferase 2 [Entamoeba marina]
MSNPTEHPTRFNKFELQSPLYEKYYKLQGIVPENEFDEFLKCIRTPLSTSFRLTKSSSTYPAVKSKFDHIISNIPTDFKPQTFEWCPDTYQLNVERKQVRKCKEYEFLHKFMVLMNEAGEICRQEIVSMIPALLLGVEVGNSVLDVCAAPGSKTSQLVEMTGPTGCVVANDADKQRSYLLTHQTKKIICTTFNNIKLSCTRFKF